MEPGPVEECGPDGSKHAHDDEFRDGAGVTVLAWIAAVCAGLGSVYWLGNLLLALRVVRSVRVLGGARLRQPESWPAVSLIIPACNEVEAIEAALRSRLADDYPALEIVLVDDRSTDGTGAIVDQLAAEDARIRVVHVHELPAGWVGKPHALLRGTELATGEWLLFSDADVHVAPGTLRRAIAYARAHRLDHLALVPELWPAGFWLDVVLATFVRSLALGARLWAIPDPRSTAAFGVGAFNLVRRSAYEHTPGFEWLRLEIVEDAALGQMLKHAGARSAVLNGRGLLGLRWYESVAAMARGAEKSVFGALGRFSFLRLAAGCAAFLLLELAPFVSATLAAIVASFGAGAIETRLLGVLCASGVAFACVAQLTLWIWINGLRGGTQRTAAARGILPATRRVLAALLFPLGALIAVGIGLRAGWLAVRRGGLLWRGTLYPTDLLKPGARFRLR